MEKLIDTSNQFGFKVYKVIAEREKGNFMVSPISAETIRCLLHSGAGNQQQLQNEERVEQLLSVLETGDDDGYALDITNTLYIKEDEIKTSGFRQMKIKSYSTHVRKVDFAKSGEAVKTLNLFTQSQTGDKIQNLISHHDLNYDTRTVLLNAVHFKANFLEPFHVHLTRKLKFRTTYFSSVEIDAMTSEDIFLYHSCKTLNAKFLELPFKNTAASLTIILPDDGNLSRVENEIHKACLRHDFKREMVYAYLPKFKIECELDLRKLLEKLGFGTLFDDVGFGDGENLSVDKVVQKIVLGVNESGVEVAAASRSGIVLSFQLEEEPKYFIVDRPFVFYIRVKEVIVLLGRVVDPSV